MEAIFFAADIIGIVWLLYWAIINDDRKPGSPTTGLFAYKETIRHYPPAKHRPPAGGPGGSPGTGPTRPATGGRRAPAQPRRNR